MTIGEKFASTNSRPAGFDYMRLILALAVVSWHTVVVTYGQDFQHEIWTSPEWRLLVAGILPAFFALSGFLVAGSLQRCETVMGFLYLRAIRIFPALVVEIVLCAFILGPTFTSFGLSKYFADYHLYSYLLNCFGDIHYNLPGLFLQNPLKMIVNGQLWTVPFELECYVVIAVLSITGLMDRSRIFALLVLSLIAIGIFDFILGHDHNAENLHGHQLVLSFLIGVSLHKFRELIPYDWRIALLAVVGSLICFWIPGGGLLAATPVAYATVFLGLTNPHRLAFLDSGDYSYGIFLYGFPIQQAVVATNLIPLNGWVTLLAAIPIIVLFAVCSWHFWEKPILNLRRLRPKIDKIFRFTTPGMIVGRMGSLTKIVSSD